MLSSIIIVAEDYTSFNREWPTDPGCRIYPSLLLDSYDEKKWSQAYQFCSEKRLKKFSLSVLARGAWSDAFLHYIPSFLFIPGYFTMHNTPVLNLVDADLNHCRAGMDQMLASAARQGIEALRFNLLIPEKQTDKSPDFLQKPATHLFSCQEQLMVFYTRSLETGDLHNQLFFLQDPQVNVAKLYTLVKSAEEKFKQTNQAAYRLASEMITLVPENALLEKKIDAINTELDNYKSHIEVMRSSHQAKELQDYYTREYEILPLWYKRFGHIIKVLMGKRSFRSLFSDNVKKYKD